MESIIHQALADVGLTLFSEKGERCLPKCSLFSYYFSLSASVGLRSLAERAGPSNGKMLEATIYPHHSTFLQFWNILQKGERGESLLFFFLRNFPQGVGGGRGIEQRTPSHPLPSRKKRINNAGRQKAGLPQSFWMGA